MNCWEYKNCGWEEGGRNAVKHGTCPAYPHFGKHCARIEYTLCDGVVESTFAQKLTHCIRCNFYNSHFYDKAYQGFRIDIILPGFARCAVDPFIHNEKSE